MKSMEDKCAIVSGGTHGIGRSIALSLAKQGCNISFFSRTQPRVDTMKRELDEIGVKNIGMTADAMDPGSIRKVENAIKDEWGGVDIIINNVGGGGRWGKEDILETDEEVWNQVYEKNFTVARTITESFLPYMIEKKWGRVITITSIYGKQIGGRPWFNVAKISQTVLMKSLSRVKKYSSNGITFNSVAPGAILVPDTGWEAMKNDRPEKYQEFVESLPMGRLGTPEEVANVVSFLCSEQASLVNGASVAVDGGESYVF